VTHFLDDPELIRLHADLAAAVTLAEWNRAVADLLHAAVLQVQGGATPPEHRARVFGLVGRVATGFVAPGAHAPPKTGIKARKDALLIFEVLFPDGHMRINAGEAVKRLMRYENEKRQNGERQVQIGEARGRVRRAMALYGVRLPPGMPGFRSKQRT